MRHYQAGWRRVKSDHSGPMPTKRPKTDPAEFAAAFPASRWWRKRRRGRKDRPMNHVFPGRPVDGTKEFVKRGGEFTVNIGEVVDGLPVSGVVLAPAIGRLFVGAAGEGAFELSGDTLRPISARAPASDGLVAVSSRSHPDAKTDALLKSLTIKGQTNAGSSLKFCLVAAGEADIYPRAGQTMEWDTAAGHAVLRAAGGSVTTWDGAPFLYGKPGFLNGPFIARGIVSDPYHRGAGIKRVPLDRRAQPDCHDNPRTRNSQPQPLICTPAMEVQTFTAYQSETKKTPPGRQCTHPAGKAGLPVSQGAVHFPTVYLQKAPIGKDCERMTDLGRPKRKSKWTARNSFHFRSWAQRRGRITAHPAGLPPTNAGPRKGTASTLHRQ